MPDAALCDEAVGERIDFAVASAQHQRLEVVVVVKVHMHGRHAEVVMIMPQRRHPARQLALVMVVDITHIGAAVLRVVSALALLFEPPSQQIAKRFGTGLIAVSGYQFIELRGQLVLDRYCYTAHGLTRMDG